MHVAPQKLVDDETVPAIAPKIGLRIGSEPRRGQDQEECEICGGFVEHPGCGADFDPKSLGGREVDIVHADCHVCDDLEPVSTGFEHRRIHLVREQTDHRIDVFYRGAEFAVFEGAIVVAAVDDFVVSQERESVSGQTTSYENAGHEFQTDPLPRAGGPRRINSNFRILPTRLSLYAHDLCERREYVLAER